jgi:tetratricopeptide (TPR) repeat protein
MDLQSLNLPENTPIIVVLWGFFIFVVWYFYRHSPQKNKVGFFTTFSVITILFFSIFFYFWLKNRPFFDPIRIAVYPFTIQNDTNKPIQWESLALSEIPANYLSQVNPDKLFPYQVDWIFTASNIDSLSSPAYVLDFSRKIKLDYVILGQLIKDSPQVKLRFQIFKLDNTKEIYKEEVVLKPTEYLKFSAHLSEIVIENILHAPSQIRFREPWQSGEQIKNYFMAKQLFLEKELDQAIKYAELSINEDSSSTASLNSLAELYLNKALEKQNRGDNALAEFKSAKRLLLQVLAIAPDESTALRLLGELYLANEKWNQAEAYLRDALKYNPWDPQIYFDFTQLYHTRYEDLGFKNEKDLLKRAIYINPCFFEARFALADYYNLKNRTDLAIKTVQEILSINPTSVDGLMALGKYHIAKNDVLNILETFEKVIKLQPDNADAYYNLGIVYYHSKDYETAVRFFERAIKLENHLNSHLYLAYIYELQGERDKAIEHLRIRIRGQTNEDDTFAEEARRHLFEIMKQRGVIDSLFSNSSNQN